MTFLPSSRPAIVFLIGIMSMNWRVYTSHDTGHFSQQQCLPGHFCCPLIEDHAPKNID